MLPWQNVLDPFWHYGIGLSDLYIFDTGKEYQMSTSWASRDNQMTDQSIFVQLI